MHTLRIAVAILILVALTGSAHAGNGTIDFATDQINLTMNLRFPPTAAQLDTMRARITTMSHTLWDSTDGQLRIGTVTITCTAANGDIADYWVYADPLRSNSPIGTNVGTLGKHVNMFFGRPGQTWAHEFAHFGFSLGDEYPEDQGLCWGKGPCIESGDDDAQNQCLLQQTDWSEFCIAANHESLKGNNAACLVNPPDANGAPCTDNCQSWNTTTLKMESSQQERINHQSCWETLKAKFPSFNVPAAPVAAEPGGFTDPVFNVTCSATSTIMLVLDRSGSMAWSVKSDYGEVCANGLDDDADGTVDETDDCADSRMAFVQAAARSIFDLASDPTVRAGIVSFDTTPTTTAGLQELAANLETLKDEVDLLSPGSQTAIGDALTHAHGLLDGDSAAADSKAAILITDGHNTAGSTPESAVPAYQASGIRLYAIATGEAANSDTISDVTANADGYAINEPSGAELVTAIAELYAQYSNGGVVVPQTQFAVNSTNKQQDPLTLEPRANLPIQFLRRRGIPGENRITFDIEEGTRNFTALLAGSLDRMSGFGVDATLRAPDGTVISSTAPPAGVRLVLDPYYTMIRISNPLPGAWVLAIRGRATAAPEQHGTLAVISDNPRTHLFADLDRHVVRNAAETVRLDLTTSYVSGLAGVDFDVTMLRPDGSIAPVTVTAVPESPGHYVATLSSFPVRGPYELRIDMRTSPATVNDPGENVPGDAPAPPLTVAVPALQRSITRRFFVDIGQWPCNGDCDQDDIPNESPTQDGDHDGVPAPNDPDDDNNEVPDARQPELGGTHGPGLGSGKGRWWFGGAVGSAHPLGNLNKIADANIYAKLDLVRSLTASLSARLALGFAQFTAQPSLAIDHPHYTHLSANVQWLAPLGPSSRWFVNGGPGWYRDESGSTSVGGNVGLGVQINAASPNVIELGVDYHFANDDRARFIAWHLGILFRP